MDITQLQKHTGFLRIIDSPIKMSGTFYVTTEANKVIEGVSEVNRIAALEIATLQAEVDELKNSVFQYGVENTKLQTERDTLQAEVDTLVKLAKDFIVQNELQGSRMEVAEYDTLKDAAFGCAEQE